MRMLLICRTETSEVRRRSRSTNNQAFSSVYYRIWLYCAHITWPYVCRLFKCWAWWYDDLDGNLLPLPDGNGSDGEGSRCTPWAAPESSFGDGSIVVVGIFPTGLATIADSISAWLLPWSTPVSNSSVSSKESKLAVSSPPSSVVRVSWTLCSAVRAFWKDHASVWAASSSSSLGWFRRRSCIENSQSKIADSLMF